MFLLGAVVSRQNQAGLTDFGIMTGNAFLARTLILTANKFNKKNFKLSRSVIDNKSPSFC